MATLRHHANVTRYLVNATNSSTAQLITDDPPINGLSPGFPLFQPNLRNADAALSHPTGQVVFEGDEGDDAHVRLNRETPLTGHIRID